MIDEQRREQYAEIQRQSRGDKEAKYFLGYIAYLMNKQDDAGKYDDREKRHDLEAYNRDACHRYVGPAGRDRDQYRQQDQRTDIIENRRVHDPPSSRPIARDRRS